MLGAMPATPLKENKDHRREGEISRSGLLDGHMHVESGMVTVTEFVRAVAVRGTTGMFVDRMRSPTSSG